MLASARLAASLPCLLQIGADPAESARLEAKKRGMGAVFAAVRGGLPSASSFSGAAVMAMVRRALAEELVQGGELPAMGVGDGAAVEAFVAGVHADVQKFFADEETYSGDAAIKAVGDVLRQMLQ